jgi:hypothetical protein
VAVTVIRNPATDAMRAVVQRPKKVSPSGMIDA